MSNITLNLPLLRRRIEDLYGTQAAFARHCGWSRQYVSRVLEGKSAMSMARLGELAAALDVPIAQIMLEKGPPLEDVLAPSARQPESILRDPAANYVAAPVHAEVEGLGYDIGAEAEKPAQGWGPLNNFASEEEWLAFVRSMRGKYRDLLSPSEEFLRRKHEEMEREESGWDLRP
jgi:transcriptional regulator with XRE-family HTH domain